MRCIGLVSLILAGIGSRRQWQLEGVQRVLRLLLQLLLMVGMVVRRRQEHAGLRGSGAGSGMRRIGIVQYGRWLWRRHRLLQQIKARRWKIGRCGRVNAVDTAATAGRRMPGLRPGQTGISVAQMRLVQLVRLVGQLLLLLLLLQPRSCKEIIR